MDTFSVLADFPAARFFFASQASFLSLFFLVLEGFFCFSFRGTWGLGTDGKVEPLGLVTDEKVEPWGLDTEENVEPRGLVTNKMVEP